MDRKRKYELRDLNARAWARDATGLASPAASLDSSLKKNTAFIKRLRTSITSSAAPTFKHEIQTLSLHKYLSEVISACYEGLCRLKTPGDIACGVEIVSGLHQRFGPNDFTSYLGWLLGRGLSTPDKSQLKTWSQDAREREEKERLARQRVLTRIVTELWLVDVLRSLDDVTRPDDAAAKSREPQTTGMGKTGEKSSRPRPAVSRGLDVDPFPLEVLKELLGHDREHANVSLAVLFVKTFSWDILGLERDSPPVPRRADGESHSELNGQAESSSADESSPEASDGPPLANSALQQRFRNVLQRYTEDVKAHVERNQKSIATQRRKNAEAYVKSGEIFEDRQANFERQCKAQEKLVANLQILSDVLGLEMPDLQTSDGAESAQGDAIGMVKAGDYLRGQGEGPGIWEDEDERRFYENIVELRDRVPAILLEDAKKKKPEGDDQLAKKAEDASPDVKGASAPEANGDASAALANKSVGAQVEALLARLPEMQTRDLIDQTAIDFCFVNTKASRNRLIKAIQDVPKGRLDLLPAFARLAATLARYFPDITQGLVAHLDDEFRSLQRRKQKEFLGAVRMANIRYLAELTKFGVVPEHVIFHCLKVALDDFSRMNIEIIANLLENAGRYLLRNPETSLRMRSFLETLQRKKSAHHLGQQERMLLENAIYYVDPPERAAIQQKERTPIDLYVRKLVYLDMNKRTYAKVLKSIRKLHWEEPEIVELLKKVFSKPARVKFSNIHLLAILVGALYRYHQDFVVTVVDNVLENITLGLEQNDFRYNQRRVAEVKYLGELYNYKMVDSTVIFDALYRLINFGHANGFASAGRSNPLDLPDDFFRIRLVCTLLDTCSGCFDRGAARKKLDFFLTFFQYYIQTKDSMPMDVDFMVQDTYALARPDWRIATTLEQAGELFAQACSQNFKIDETERLAEPEEPDDESSSDNEDVEEIALPEDEAQSSSDEADEDAKSNGGAHSDSDFEDVVVLRQQEQERDPEAEADFDRELAKLMGETGDSRRVERKPAFDLPLPLRRPPTRDSAPNDEAPTPNLGETAAPASSGKMAFSLMTKRGNKPQTRSIDLPSDSSFVVALRSRQEAERAEQQRIKSLVLNYDLQDSSADATGLDGDRHIHNASLPYNSSGSGHGHAKSADRSNPGRGAPRTRKLQLSDVDWT